MSPVKALRSLARGDGTDGRLLGACRLEWAGAEAYGEEAIGEVFAAAPLDLDEAEAVRTAAGLALIGRDVALVADLYDGRFGRLWRLGPGEPPATEPAVAVAFDPDLRQERGRVYLDPRDHPELAPGAVAAVEAVGRAARDGIGLVPLHRARSFAVRAFSDADATAALFAVHRLVGGAVRSVSFAYAAAFIDGSGARLVLDQWPAPVRTESV